MSKIIEAYCDGGVIASNPSSIGGTYAYRLIYDDGHIEEYHTATTPAQMGVDVITNNQTEMIAALMMITQLPHDFEGTVYSDSAVTLGRIFKGWKWKNIPQRFHEMYKRQRIRFTNWDKIKYVQLDGHPTKAQLASGIGKRGNPVSEHNVWCDEACQKAGEGLMAELRRCECGVSKDPNKFGKTHLHDCPANRLTQYRQGTS